MGYVSFYQVWQEVGFGFRWNLDEPCFLNNGYLNLGMCFDVHIILEWDMRNLLISQLPLPGA